MVKMFEILLTLLIMSQVNAIEPKDSKEQKQSYNNAPGWTSWIPFNSQDNKVQQSGNFLGSAMSMFNGFTSDKNNAPQNVNTENKEWFGGVRSAIKSVAQITNEEASAQTFGLSDGMKSMINVITKPAITTINKTTGAISSSVSAIRDYTGSMVRSKFCKMFGGIFGDTPNNSFCNNGNVIIQVTNSNGENVANGSAS